MLNIILYAQRDMDRPNRTPIENPMSILTLAVLSIILTVTQMKTRILDSGSKAQDMRDSRNHESW